MDKVSNITRLSWVNEVLNLRRIWISRANKGEIKKAVPTTQSINLYKTKLGHKLLKAHKILDNLGQ